MESSQEEVSVRTNSLSGQDYGTCWNVPLILSSHRRERRRAALGRHAQLGKKFLERLAHFKRMIAAFQRTGASDDRHRQVIGKGNIVNAYAMRSRRQRNAPLALLGGCFMSRRLNQTRVLDCRSDKAGKERVRRERARFQFGVELHPDKPGMVAALDNFR